MVDTKKADTPEEAKPAAQKTAVDKNSNLITPKRKYFYPESGTVRTRATNKATVKTKSENEEQE